MKNYELLQANQANQRAVNHEVANEAFGSVALVGAGPGDPNLLTIKAYQELQTADVVVYDQLVSREILQLIPATTETIKVGKQCNKPSATQSSINELLVQLAQQGKRVCRLKGGDPFVFGRGGEEALTLIEHGIKYEVVPGITAALGCSAYSGIPITHRGISRGFTVITAHGKDEEYQVPWQSLAQLNHTLVFYMGLNRAKNIQTQLISSGLAPQTPVAVISNGTTDNHSCMNSTLEHLVADISRHQCPTPALIIVGEVVSLADSIAWREKVAQQQFVA
ncbi:MAG: uroporphyrinogen-III C-methyltransferase [Vibrio sp.]